MTRILATYSDIFPNENLETLAQNIQAKMIAWQKIKPAAGLEILPLAVWDYSFHIEAFLAWIDELENTQVRVLNSPSLIRWNINKRYLIDLAERLPFITPSKLVDKLENIPACGWQNPVIKPLIGQSGNGVQRFNDPTPCFSTTGYLVQPFIEIQRGEICLIYLNGQFSHAIMRVLAENEWRANSKYQATPIAIEAEPSLIEIGDAVIRELPELPLYARIDILPTKNNQFLVNEVELIEPALYPHLTTDFSKKFLMALDSR